MPPVQHHAEVVRPAEGVVPWKPINEIRRPVLKECEHLRDLLSIAAQHPLRVDDALRRARRSRSKHDLAHGIRADRLERLIDFGRDRRRQPFRDARTRSSLRQRTCDHAFNVTEDLAQCTPIQSAVIREDEARRAHGHELLELRKVVR